MKFTVHIFVVAVMALGGACTTNTIAPFPDDFVGVGVELTMQNELPTVVRTIDGGPAQTAGLKANDLVVAINDISVTGLGLADVVVRLRGAEGSLVNVTLQRGDDRLEAQIVRRGLHKAGEDYAPALRAAR